MKTTPSRSARAALSCLASLALASVACSNASSDDDGSDDTAAHLCDLYAELHRDCGYQKFDDRTHCEEAHSGYSDAEAAQWEAYYDCLGGCRGSGQSIDDLSATCAITAFGSSGEWATLCERTCERQSAARCPRSASKDACVAACQQMVAGDCRNGATALDACMPTYACDATGGLVADDCAGELVAFDGCARAFGAGSSPTPGAPADFAARAATAFCNGISVCCSAAGIAFDEDACEAAVLTSLPPDTTSHGKVVWDTAAGERCIAAYGALGAACTPTLAERAAFSPACDRLFAPGVQPGEPCEYNDECVDIGGAPAVCVSPSMLPNDALICSEDVNRLPAQHGRAGDPCSASCILPGLGDCSRGPAPAGSVNTACYSSEGFACDFLTSTCVALAGIGEPCGRGCGGGSYCDGSTCVAQKSDGATCSDPAECASWACSSGHCGLAQLASPWLCGSEP